MAKKVEGDQECTLDICGSVLAPALPARTDTYSTYNTSYVYLYRHPGGSCAKRLTALKRAKSANFSAIRT